MKATVYTILFPLLLFLNISEGAIVTMEFRGPGMFNQSRLQGTGGRFVANQVMTIELDNGGSSFRNQTWSFDQLVSFSITVPDYAFTLRREQSEILASYISNSLPGASSNVSTLQIVSDANGNLTTGSSGWAYFDRVITSANIPTSDPANPFVDLYGASQIAIEPIGGTPAFALRTAASEPLLGFFGTTTSLGALNSTISIQAVPEPSSLLILFVSIASSLIYRKR